MRVHAIFMLVVITLLGCANVARADFDFTAITSNDPLNPGIGEAQFSMSASDLGSGQVLLEVFNAGPEPSSIELIAFDTAIAAEILGVVDGSGTNFEIDSNPRNLPGGHPVEFYTDFSVSADNPRPVHGVNPGESIGIILLGDFTSIYNALDNGAMRVGLHAISMGESGNSEAFVSHMPGPGTLGVLVLAVINPRRRRRTLA